MLETADGPLLDASGREIVKRSRIHEHTTLRALRGGDTVES
jgi:hypothetical protein